MVGRSRDAHRGEERRRGRAPRCSRWPGSRWTTTGAPRGGRRRPGRDARARCSASRACRATGRPSWSRPSWACGRSSPAPWPLGGRDMRGHRQRTCCSPGSATCRRTAAPTAWSRTSPSPRTWCSTCTTGRRSARRFALNLDAIARRRGSGSQQFDVRTPSAERAGRFAVGRQPAEGHRGPGDVAAAEAASSRRSRPAAWTSGSIEFIHGRIIARARGRHRRAAGLQRAGRGARAGRPDRGDVPRPGHRRRVARHAPEKIGLLMAGVTPRQACEATRRQRSRHERSTPPLASREADPDQAATAATGPGTDDGTSQRATADEPPSKSLAERFVEGLWRANTVTVTAAGDRARDGHRRHPDRRLQPGTAVEVQLLLRPARRRVCRRAGRRSATPTPTCSRARSSTPKR